MSVVCFIYPSYLCRMNTNISMKYVQASGGLLIFVFRSLFVKNIEIIVLPYEVRLIAWCNEVIWVWAITQLMN